MGPLYNDIGELVVSVGGGHVGYTAKQAGYWFAVIDGKPSSQFSKVEGIAFSFDGKHVAYKIARRNKQLIVVDNQPHAEFDKVSVPFFDSSGTKVAYVANQRKEAFVVIGEKKAGPFDFALEGGIHFSPDGQSVAFAAVSGNELWWKVVKP